MFAVVKSPQYKLKLKCEKENSVLLAILFLL